ncbi:hypothetical protein SprV_0100124200 [Sparganum proliferum]
MSIFTPINQKRLTNVSVVRLKKNGNREKNIDEVLQTQEIFSNVSKGQLATKSDILRDFDTDDINVVLHQILSDGDIQFTGKERKIENQNMYRDVAKIVSEKCINCETNRAFTVTMIEKMMKDCHINLQPKKSAKQQRFASRTWLYNSRDGQTSLTTVRGLHVIEFGGILQSSRVADFGSQRHGSTVVAGPRVAIKRPQGRKREYEQKRWKD